ncbi:histidine kinase [Anopheles sinensis]|uniref:Histidine kinase n=1 Tax=Anopheles sinensis TaxID=74873 RepID=A0A084WB11_ANOSI|nr:histidine kinase [Anopheles sinensis]
MFEVEHKHLHKQQQTTTRVVAPTSPENGRSLDLLLSRGWSIDDVVVCLKIIVGMTAHDSVVLRSSPICGGIAVSMSPLAAVAPLGI